MPDSQQDIFVFVVCGSKEYIETLNYSIKFLRHFSRKQIIVVTDPVRNEILIDHDYIIPVTTPVEFNHHKASIYLKTGLHKFLPPGNVYCYLDTDVIALRPEVDAIFHEFVPPVTFAPDHCRMNHFSSMAMRCNCRQNFLQAVHTITRLELEYDKNMAVKDQHQRKLLLEDLEKLENSKFLKQWNRLRYHFSGETFVLGNSIYYKDEKYWTNRKGEPILYDVDINYVKQRIESETPYRWDESRHAWLGHDGEQLAEHCDHLKMQIKETFDIDVRQSDWQHWNGGVFLFNDTSSEFMEAWHQKCLKIFNLDTWAVRDQGTLIATAWEFGLQNHPILSKRWNFLADAQLATLVLDKEAGTISDDNFTTSYEPAFIHVYHDFGKKGWIIWDWIEEKARQLNSIAFSAERDK
jgi:hypothetical protein